MQATSPFVRAIKVLRDTRELDSEHGLVSGLIALLQQLRSGFDRENGVVGR